MAREGGPAEPASRLQKLCQVATGRPQRMALVKAVQRSGADTLASLVAGGVLLPPLRAWLEAFEQGFPQLVPRIPKALGKLEVGSELR